MNDSSALNTGPGQGTSTAGDSTELLPCPFCGAGDTVVGEQRLPPTMRGPGALISVMIRHWCEKLPGVVGGGLEFRGRDHASAVAAWNRRSPAVK